MLCGLLQLAVAATGCDVWRACSYWQQLRVSVAAAYCDPSAGPSSGVTEVKGVAVVGPDVDRATPTLRYALRCECVRFGIAPDK